MQVGLTLLSVLFRPSATGCQQTLLPEISSEADSGFHNLVFSIQRVGKALSGAQLLDVAGTYHTQPVALGVLLRPAWKGSSGAPELPTVMYQGAVELLSLGQQSDRLLTAIDELYGTAQRPHSMRSQTTFAGVSLEGDPRHLEAGSTTIKLFFESDDETRYAELYLVIDWGTGKVHLDEKDPDYRPAIVRALSAP